MASFGATNRERRNKGLQPLKKNDFYGNQIKNKGNQTTPTSGVSSPASIQPVPSNNGVASGQRVNAIDMQQGEKVNAIDMQPGQMQNFTGQQQSYTGTLPNIYGNQIDIDSAKGAGIQGNYMNTGTMTPEQRANLDYNNSIALGGEKAEGGIGAGSISSGANNFQRIGGQNRQETSDMLSNFADQQRRQLAEQSARSQIDNQIEQQVSGIDQALARQKQAAEQQQAANQQYLTEQLDQFGQQRNTQLDQATALQNRRGGFYSGGLDYQHGQVNSSINQATEGLTRDIATRNNDIWSNYGQLASQASERIEMLRTQAPDQIRQLMNEELDRQRQTDMQESQLTGDYRGQQTQQAQDQQFNQGIQQGQLTGQYDGQRTLPGQQFDWQQSTDQRNFDYGQQRDQVGDEQWNQQFTYGQQRDNVQDQQWQQQFDQGGQQFAEQMGLQWDQLDQRERQMYADEAYRQQQFNQQTMNDQFARGIQVMNETGQVPDYMKNYGVNTDALNGADAETKSMIEGVYKDLSDGMDGGDILKTINDREKIGMLSPEQSKSLKDTLYLLDPSLDPSRPKTETGLVDKVKGSSISQTARMIYGFLKGVTDVATGNFQAE